MPPLTISDLPDDLDTVKRMTIHYATENAWLREQIRLFQARMFGRTSEQFPYPGDTQLPLFSQEMPAEPDKKESTTPVKSHERRKPGRQPLPDSLPRKRIVHDISEAEKQCGCGAQKACIGEEVSEQLEYEPARLFVNQHVRPKYACPHCEGVDDPSSPTVAIVPVAPQIVPKGIGGPGIVAHVLATKFVDSVPFYRQESQFKRLGFKLGRATMCNWAMKVAEACAPLLELLHQEILAGPLVGCDETRLQVLDEPGRAPTTESYMWVFVGGPPERPCVVFRYSPSRGGNVAATFLKGYQGGVQTDGYSGYDFLDAMPGIVHYGCWAHARRKFADVVKAAEKHCPVDRPKGLADEAIERIRLLYAIDASTRDQGMSADEILAVRQSESRPLVDFLQAWLAQKTIEVPPKSLLGKAMAYALSQWPRLERCFNDGLVRLDNNEVENMIRPFALGRKNWLFSGTPEGAEASATLFSLIQTARANHIEPYRYLRCLFERLPLVTTTEERRLLLPPFIDRDWLGPP